MHLNVWIIFCYISRQIGFQYVLKGYMQNIKLVEKYAMEMSAC